jgi:hypothetical protein
MSALERGPRSGDDADAAALVPLVPLLPLVPLVPLLPLASLLLRGGITGAPPPEGDGQSPTLS